MENEVETRKKKETQENIETGLRNYGGLMAWEGGWYLEIVSVTTLQKKECSLAKTDHTFYKKQKDP